MLTAGTIILVLGAFAWILAVLKRVDLSLAPSLTTTFGLIVSAGSLLPYKEITPRRLSIAKYAQLKLECEKIESLPEDKRVERLNTITEILNRI